MLTLIACNNNEKDSFLSPDKVSVVNPISDLNVCDGRWHCYPEKGYAVCNGKLGNPKVDYDEVC